MNRIFSLTLFLSMTILSAIADDTVYNVEMKMDVVDATGTKSENQQSFNGSAPITAYVSVTTTDETGAECTDVTYTGQWRVWRKGGEISSPSIERTDNPTQFKFSDGGTYYITWVGKVTKGDYTICEFDEDYGTYNHFTVAAATSELVFGNAFSPNGDGYNDKFKAKTVKSITDFHATIYSRSGQRLYQWDDPYDGWDGTFNGKDVKDGVYYIQVKATGADGTEFDIKKAVNLMRGYIDTTNSEY